MSDTKKTKQVVDIISPYLNSNEDLDQLRSIVQEFDSLLEQEESCATASQNYDEHSGKDDDQQFFDYLPAYHLLHLNAGYSVGRIAMSLKMNNVFNQDYQAVLWRPMPGRNVELSLSYQFQKENP